MSLDSILQRLAGGDRRSTGRADEVAAEAKACPEMLAVLVAGMRHADPLVRMRAADALEKATLDHPERLQPYAAEILETAAAATQQEVRWHAAQLMGRIAWTAEQRQQAAGILYHYLQDRSRIVVTFSLQALADLARQEIGNQKYHHQEHALLDQLMPLLAELSHSPSGAVRSRATRLQVELSRIQRQILAG